jgi:hypothetical protein
MANEFIDREGGGDWGESLVDALLTRQAACAEVLGPVIETVRQIRHALAATPKEKEDAARELAIRFLRDVSAAARLGDLPALKAELIRYVLAFRTLVGN